MLVLRALRHFAKGFLYSLPGAVLLPRIELPGDEVKRVAVYKRLLFLIEYA